MYKVQQIPRKLLISTDEIIEMAPTDDDVAVRQLLSSIQIAEERFVRNLLCYDLYEDFRNQKNQVVTAINLSFLTDETGIEGLIIGDIVNAIEFVTNPYYIELWYEHLWKLDAEAVTYIATPINYTRFAAAGEMMRNPSNLIGGGSGNNQVSADLATMQWKMDKMLLDRVESMIEATKRYLRANSAFIPNYNCDRDWARTETAVRGGETIPKRTAWIRGIYDDPRAADGCNKCEDR